MKRLKSLLAAALVALLSAALILPIAACHEDDPTDGTNAIYITSKGGMALPNVTVELFMNGSSVSAKKTDEEGKVTYNLSSDTEYTVTLSDVPVGFITENSYKVKGSEETTRILLDSKVITEGTKTSYYTKGDVLYDFEENYYTYNADGTEPTLKTTKLSEIFAAGKKAVLINFFYNNCTWCNREYPYIRDAYNKFSKDMEVLAINDVDPTNPAMPGEYESDVKALVQTDKVPYLMCKDGTANVGRLFNDIVQGNYPTSIMIDRYGILCFIYQGANVTQSFWDELFAKYTDENYSQDVKPGNETGEIFVPDLPGDFPVSMPASSELNAKINNTGRNVTFSKFGENSSYGWPWDLTAEQDAIYPTNSGHKGTMAVIYAQIDLQEDEVVAFDYKLSTMPENDYFYVSIDSRKGTGRQISMTSGIEDWQTGYAYAALEAGTHEIEFTYYRSTAEKVLDIDDKVYIKNLRIVSVEEMNQDLTESKETFEIPYFATRSYNNKTKQFEVIEDVYLASDGYYHIGTKANATANDPYLLLDITHSTPYFGKNSENLQKLMYSEIALNGGIYIGDDDYTDTFRSYLSFSTNSAYTGLIPVNKDVQEALFALYDFNTPSGAPFYSEDGWMQFCVYYKQYGVQKDISDPIKGLAYYSAFKTNETTGQENFIEVEKGKGQYVLDTATGHFVDVEGTARQDDANYVLNPVINKVHFENVIMPRGYMYEFTPSKSGVYSIKGIDCYYYNADEAVIDDEATDADLYNGDLKISHAYAMSIASSGSDRYERNSIPNSFKIIHYLEAGKTYYINVAFRVVETTGDFAFRVDYLGEEYSYIYQASSGYTLDENYSMVLLLYCDPYYDEANDVWLDRKGGGKIFVDFTQLSAMLDYYTIEQILNDDIKTAQFTFDISKEKFKTVDEEGNPIEIDISLDLEKRYGGEKNIPDTLKEVLAQYEIADYTTRMKYYLEKSKEGKEVTDEEYGLMPVNNELYCILQLFNAKFFGFDTPTEWLRACCFRLNVNENFHG